MHGRMDKNTPKPATGRSIRAIGMHTRRNQRGRQRERVAVIKALRSGLTQHFRTRLMAYVPASLPVLLFILAHGGILLTLILIKSGVLSQAQAVHKTMVTWAVYGILPLFFCSYLCFFVLARPLSDLLTRRFSEWSPLHHTLIVGLLYGVGVSLALMLLFKPNTMQHFCFLLAIGMSTGLGNWFLYRCLTVVPLQQISEQP